MSKHLNRARTYFGTDTRGLLEGGRYALLHTRSLEFDDLRPYVPGDDVRDIDWKASARSGSVLIKRFVDEKHGWAVGALGTILATDDGGRTWRRQRAGGTRAALLGLFSDGRDVPLELLARLSGNEGYLGAVEVLGRRDVEVKSNHRTHPADRLQEAVVAVGASDAHMAWRFPLRQLMLRLIRVAFPFIVISVVLKLTFCQFR